jgi:hypothetical protein
MTLINNINNYEFGTNLRIRVANQIGKFVFIFVLYVIKQIRFKTPVLLN